MVKNSITFTLPKPAVNIFSFSLDDTVWNPNIQVAGSSAITVTHEWTYMGNRLASLLRSKKPVKVQCPKCHNKVKMDIKNARGPGIS